MPFENKLTPKKVFQKEFTRHFSDLFYEIERTSMGEVKSKKSALIASLSAPLGTLGAVGTTLAVAFGATVTAATGGFAGVGIAAGMVISRFGGTIIERIGDRVNQDDSRELSAALDTASVESLEPFLEGVLSEVSYMAADIWEQQIKGLKKVDKDGNLQDIPNFAAVKVLANKSAKRAFNFLNDKKNKDKLTSISSDADFYDLILMGILNGKLGDKEESRYALHGESKLIFNGQETSAGKLLSYPAAKHKNGYYPYASQDRQEISNHGVRLALQKMTGDGLFTNSGTDDVKSEVPIQTREDIHAEFEKVKFSTIEVTKSDIENYRNHVLANTSSGTVSTETFNEYIAAHNNRVGEEITAIYRPKEKDEVMPDLSGCNFEGSVFFHLNLAGQTIRNASFKNVKFFSYPDFQNLVLENVCLDDAQANFANWFESHFKNCSAKGFTSTLSNMEGMIMDEFTQVDGANVSHSMLDRANIMARGTMTMMHDKCRGREEYFPSAVDEIRDARRVLDGIKAQLEEMGIDLMDGKLDLMRYIDEKISSIAGSDSAEEAAKMHESIKDSFCDIALIISQGKEDLELEFSGFAEEIKREMKSEISISLAAFNRGVKDVEKDIKDFRGESKMGFEELLRSSREMRSKLDENLQELKEIRAKMSSKRNKRREVTPWFSLLEDESSNILGQESDENNVICVGRGDDCEDIESRFSASRMVVLSGPGGLGKSTLAKEYVEKKYVGSREGITTAIFIDVSAVKNNQSYKLMIEEIYLKIAQTINEERSKRGLDEIDEKQSHKKLKKSVNKELQAISGEGSCLLVLDDAKYCDLIKGNFPKEVELLITSREADENLKKEELKVIGGFKKEVSASYLMQGLSDMLKTHYNIPLDEKDFPGNELYEDAIKLANRLHNYPLALAHASSYVRKYIPEDSKFSNPFEEYFHLFDKNSSLIDSSRVDHYGATMQSCIGISLNNLIKPAREEGLEDGEWQRRIERSEMHYDLLMHIVTLKIKPVNKEFLMEYFESKGVDKRFLNLEVRSAVEAFRENSFLLRESELGQSYDDPESYKVHDMVSEMLTRIYERKAGYEEKCIEIFKLAKKPNGENNLHIAASLGNEILCKFLIKNNIESIDAMNDLGQSALHIEAKNGNKEMCQVLIEEFGANINLDYNDNHCTPLYYAVKNGQEEVCKLLLEKEASHYRNDREKSLLEIAMENDHVSTSVLLVEEKIYSGENYFFSPFGFAIEKGNLEVVQRLIDNEDVSIYTAEVPHSAVQGGNIEICELLIKKGFFKLEDINYQDKLGQTPLFYAESLEMALWLIGKGADVNIEDCQGGGTLLHKAVGEGNKQMCELLINNGADVNAVDDDGNMALSFADDPDMCEFLTSRGIDVGVEETALHYAARTSADPDDIELILNSDEVITPDDKIKSMCRIITNIDCGTLEESFESCKLLIDSLIESGTDLNNIDQEYKDLLDDALWNVYASEIANYLVEEGAFKSITVEIKKGEVARIRQLSNAKSEEEIEERPASTVEVRQNVAVRQLNKDKSEEELGGMAIPCNIL